MFSLDFQVLVNGSGGDDLQLHDTITKFKGAYLSDAVTSESENSDLFCSS